MGAFIIFLVIIFLIFYLPKIAMWAAKFWLRRKLRNSFGEAFDNPNGARDANKNKKTSPPVKPKKIDPSVGEYVRFEEVEVTAETTTATDSQGNTTTKSEIKVEEQIVDVEWEDL